MNPENNNLNEMRIVACERLISNIESFQEEAPRDINLLLALDRAKFAAAYFNHNRLQEGRDFFAAANEYFSEYIRTRSVA